MAKSTSVEVKGAEEVIKLLERFEASTLKGKKTMGVTVGYTAPYAIYVHENLQSRHPNGGQAKFLEQPMREKEQDMVEIVIKNLKNKESLDTALTRAGKFLMQESQALCPVDTGVLRDSAFVALDE